ncbi:helix-turn-helix domain-containing protein [Nocardiopsis flavescens]
MDHGTATTWLTIAQVARLWGVAADTVEDWIQRGWLVSRTDHGGRHLIPEDAARAVLEEARAARAAKNTTKTKRSR